MIKLLFNILITFLLSVILFSASQAKDCQPLISEELDKLDLTKFQKNKICEKMRAIADFVAPYSSRKTPLNFFFKNKQSLINFSSIAVFAPGLRQPKKPSFKNVDIKIVWFPWPDAKPALEKDVIDGVAQIPDLYRPKSKDLLNHLANNFADSIVLTWNFNITDLRPEPSRIAGFDIHNFRLGMTMKEAKEIIESLSIEKKTESTLATYYYAYHDDVKVYFHRNSKRIFKIIYEKVIYSDKRPSFLDIMSKAKAKYGESDSGIYHNNITRVEFALWGDRKKSYMECELSFKNFGQYLITMMLVDTPMENDNRLSWQQDVRDLKRLIHEKQVGDIKF